MIPSLSYLSSFLYVTNAFSRFFFAWRTSVWLISSGETPPISQPWMTSEKHCFADISSFCLGNSPVLWSFWSWFWWRKIHDQILYWMTPSSSKSEMMDRWPYAANWTAVIAMPHSRWRPYHVTPSSRKFDIMQWCNCYKRLPTGRRLWRCRIHSYIIFWWNLFCEFCRWCRMAWGWKLYGGDLEYADEFSELIGKEYWWKSRSQR